MSSDYRQQLILTLLPFSCSSAAGMNTLRFSVVISPRLSAAAPSDVLFLDSWLDWCNPGDGSGKPWPTTVQALIGQLKLSLTDSSSNTTQYPVQLTTSAQVGGVFGQGQPDAAFFAAVFPGGDQVPVVPYSYTDYSGMKIRSAPVGTIEDNLLGTYAGLGIANPYAFPGRLEALDGGFAAVGFQGSGDPPALSAARKAVLLAALDAELAANKAVPYDLSAIARTTPYPNAATSLAYLQHQQFLQRELPKVSTPTTSPAAPSWDFHQAVAGLGSMPTLLRKLGLVLDLEASVPISVTGNVTASLVAPNVDHVHLVFSQPTSFIVPATMAAIAPNSFTAISDPASDSDHTGQMLKLGDTSLYRIIRLDHDSAAIKAIQFGNNMSRAGLNSDGSGLGEADTAALPALRTGGFAFARSGRAVQMVAQLERQTSALQNGGNAPTVWLDDLIRGYRFDVYDPTDGVWRSLMWRSGPIAVTGQDPFTVTEEDTVVPAPTTQSGDPESDTMYLQETLARWDGWSLAVPRLGKAFSGSTGTQSGTNGSTGFNITTDWSVPGSVTTAATQTASGNAGRLPRLRFGRSYRFRARAADLAGNSLTLVQAPAPSVEDQTAPYAHLRFEPVAAPRALLPSSNLWSTGGSHLVRPGESEEVIVVRSESATVSHRGPLDNALASRIFVPAPTSVFMAEQHGAWDLGSTGQPMDQSLYTSIAKRDAAKIDDLAVTLSAFNNEGDAGTGTSNPMVFPDGIPISYLADFLGRSMVVRDLPFGGDKSTSAELSFDPANQGWANQQSVSIYLGKAPADDWQQTVPSTLLGACTEPASVLEIALAPGHMRTLLVNSLITQAELDQMALWDWIQTYAAENDISLTRFADTIILPGRHWMFTPWREVTVVHAVRTPLEIPQLSFKPTKSAIGQTYALIEGTEQDPLGGTIQLSRCSTARITVHATWSMPIDTGVNDDPVTPQKFAVDALNLDLPRDGSGYVEKAGAAGVTIVSTVDAVNLDLQHEFGDTKFRAVTYTGTATSYYPEYFRLHRTLTLSGDPITALADGPVTPGVPFEGATVELTLTGTKDGAAVTRRLVAAPVGTDAGTAAPTPGDFVVVEDPTLNGATPLSATQGTIQVLANSPVISSDLTDPSIDFSYVEPTIHTFSDPAKDGTKNMVVPNSARPSAPDVLYIMPIYKRSARRHSAHRVGGGLRVYLNRPWWSSGDGERLGVVTWHQPTAKDGVLPDASLAPFVTQWGFDPIFSTDDTLPAQPTPHCFPLADALHTTGSLSLAETSEKVDVAGHEVGFDASRNLWYCDIQVTDPHHRALRSYTPFIRLALARYQPNSIANAALSRVVLCDYAQLAPNRSVTVTGRGPKARTVTVSGPGPINTSMAPATSYISVTVEEKDSRITDDALAWSPVPNTAGFRNTTAFGGNYSRSIVTWTGQVALPPKSTKPLRLTFEEYEHHGSATSSNSAVRLAYTESIPI